MACVHHQHQRLGNGGPTKDQKRHMLLAGVFGLSACLGRRHVCRVFGVFDAIVVLRHASRVRRPPNNDTIRIHGSRGKPDTEGH